MSVEHCLVHELLDRYKAKRDPRQGYYEVHGLRVYQDRRLGSTYCKALEFINMGGREWRNEPERAATLLHELGHHFAGVMDDAGTPDDKVREEAAAWEWAQKEWRRVFPTLEFPHGYKAWAFGSYLRFSLETQGIEQPSRPLRRIELDQLMRDIDVRRLGSNVCLSKEVAQCA